MSSFPSSNSTNPNVDNYLLETLMDRLQLRAPVNNPLVSQSLEDYLFGDDDSDDDNVSHEVIYDGKSALYKEESKLENEVIKTILSGKAETLKPNSGQAVTVRDHQICVGCQEEENGEYLVWEWHGHIMAYSEKYGYSPEYVYGNYFQRVKPPRPPSVAATPLHKEEEEKGKPGLKEIFDCFKEDYTPGRILHRNINAGPSRSPISYYSPFFLIPVL